jgi:hypothetical protein
MTHSLIEAAAPRTFTKRDGNQMTLFEVTINGRKWVARKPVFDVAEGLVSQMADVTTRVEQNGNYTNYYLDEIKPVAAAKASSDYAEDPERSERIARQTATKVAAIISTHDPQAFWANVDDLVHYYMTGDKPIDLASMEGYAEPSNGGAAQTQAPDDDSIPF